MKRNLFVLCVACVCIFVAGMSNHANAQPQYYNYNTAGVANSFPFNISSGKSVQLLYLPGDFNQPTAAPAGTITSISFMINPSYPLGPWTYTDFTIKMGQSSITSFDADAFYSGSLTTVYSAASVSLTGTPGSWMTITLNTPFAYDPTKSLIVDVSQNGAPLASGYSACYTPLTGNRRNWSVGGAPFVYSGQNTAVYHMGISLSGAPPTAVPTLSEWGMIIFAGLIALTSLYCLMKRRYAV
jgi:hypothetical protein